MDVDDGAHPVTPPQHDDAHPVRRRSEDRRSPSQQLRDDNANEGGDAANAVNAGNTQPPPQRHSDEHWHPNFGSDAHGSPSAPPLAPPPRRPMTETLYIALPPKDQSMNPHRKLRDYDPISTGPEGLEARISFQMNLSPFDAVVLDVEHELRNVDPKFLTQMDRNPDQWTLISFFLRGSLFFELWKPNHLIEEVTKALVNAQLAEADDIEILPLPLLNEEKDPYGTSMMAM
ncbi:hypothetical protein MSAN_01697100 [Mycena sanguinolenta]|uniref:Uncharacterized protein n=1 Tax=Mycena sanguinolenta TaxID=230812 RepID=A0A8H6XY25_9AGAR|nr:hypothetical protein MSAN_01697100 [Mycena sanguinolenta]